MATLGEMFGAGGVETFLGLPRCRNLDGPGAEVVLLGADAGTPYPAVGAYCRGGPAAIRAASAAYAANRHHLNFDLGGPMLPEGVRAADAGDLAIDDAAPAANRAAIAGAVGRLVAAGAVPVLLGGDDSVQIPMLAALAGVGEPVSVLQIDAHIDWRDEVGGERLGLSSTMRRASEMGHIASMVQVGARGVGSARPQDVADARARGVTLVPAAEVHQVGIGRALAALPADGSLAICLDLDALDPAVMPAVIGRTAGGLSYGQVLGLILGAAARARIVAVGVVEFMPGRDIDGMGATTAQQLVAAIVGTVARQAAARSGG
jgi:agmatinase